MRNLNLFSNRFEIILCTQFRYIAGTEAESPPA